MVERDPSLPTGFRIYQKLDDGIYECEPIGVRHLGNNYPYWIIALLDLKEIKGDLVDVHDFRVIKGEENYYTATANGMSIIATPSTRIDIDSEDEYDSIGVPKGKVEPTPENEKEDVARLLNEKYFKTPKRQSRKSDIRQAPTKAPYERSERSERSRSPKREKLVLSPYSSKIKKISEIRQNIQSTIPATIPLFKKKKNSLRKSKNGIKCKKTPYAWKSSSIKKSPFRKLERAKDAERQYKAGKSIGFTAISSLKSLGRIPRSDGCYALGAKYSALKRH
jgi:hypothetical protein